ncbi:large ribosomal subunit protein mL62 isoform X1 [Pleurodeles waltl]|uniref:large ribosomal subunit protein mL62 isoform X1 n=1 Tax=Pleurodeles waltl TaxID=8319 RepID=UPI003709BBBB
MYVSTPRRAPEVIAQRCFKHGDIVKVFFSTGPGVCRTSAASTSFSAQHWIYCRIPQHLQSGEALSAARRRGERAGEDGVQLLRVGPSSDFEIPTDRLRISYSRSSGPGGQNVNKVNTKAEIRFHLASADWISEDVRLKIAEKHKNKINKSGELILTSEVSRYQMRNLADCLQKLRDMVTESSTKPKVASKEEAEVRRMRVLAMNRERLQQKKIHSTVKQSRRVDVD